MIFPLDPLEKLILVPTRVFGPHRQSILRFALDTGATRSMINLDAAIEVGYSPNADTDHVEITTASGVEVAPTILLARLEVLGQELVNFPILCHNLPPAVDVDGILGLDFLRGHKLTLDFRMGLLILE